jgi:hypothetical protein
MHRKILFLLISATASAQQTGSAPTKAEKALRARAQQFFQLEVDKKYREGEALVAADSRDEYYNGGKYNIKSFTIQKVEFQDKNTRAKVTIDAKVTLLMPQAGAMDFDAPVTSYWKIEKGHWVLYFDSAARQTPFGVIKPGQDNGKSNPFDTAQKAPSVAALQESVKLDKNSIVLTGGGPPETVTVSNSLPGGVDLDVQSALAPGLSWRLEKKHLEAGEKSTIRFQAGEGSKGKGVVHLLVSPTGAQLDILVTLN